ncbi:peptidoglycan synthetase, partial [Klebsiella pneumoniae]
RAEIAFSAPYLSEMVRQEMVNRYGEQAYEDGYRQLSRAEIAFSAPYLSEMVRQEMVNRYGEQAYEDGYR